MRPQVAIIDELLSRARAQPDDPDTYTRVVDRDLGVASETKVGRRFTRLLFSGWFRVTDFLRIRGVVCAAERGSPMIIAANFLEAKKNRYESLLDNAALKDLLGKNV
jgi:hypothetical protein